MHGVDLHQHLWPATFVELLRRRTRAPYLHGWRLVTEEEPAYEIRPGDHDVERRIDLDRLAGVGLACVSLSAPLGIESLPRDEAGALIEAWHAGVRDLPGTSRRGPRCRRWSRIGRAADLLGGAFVGVQLPATARALPDGMPSGRSCAWPS